jgi:beta-galactosidase
VPDVRPGDSVLVALPALSGDTLTVQAVLAADQPWAKQGHEIAWAQLPAGPAHDARPPTTLLPRRDDGVLTAAPAMPVSRRDDGVLRVGPAMPVSRRDDGVLTAAPAMPVSRRDDGVLTVGPAVLDERSGDLVRLGSLAVSGPRMQAWRAPTDNDRAPHGEALEPVWRRLGLDRMTRRLTGIEVDGGRVVVRSRYAPAATDLGLLLTCTWTGLGANEVGLTVDIDADGRWPCPLPMLGVLFGLPAELTQVEWLGRGPGEAYPDTGQAARAGHFAATVAEMQTPYLFPQENGRRADVRWASVADGRGAGLRVDGVTPFGLTVRPWTTEALDRAAHHAELRPDGRTWLTIDAGHNGIGSASCGPALPPRYLLAAASVRLDLRLTA